MLAPVLLLLSTLGQTAPANVRPQIGYVYPPGGSAGKTIDVRLGTYDWTPDMQVFVHDPRVKLELVGQLGDPILTPPPYWFGPKASVQQPPVPREIAAKLTIPDDFPPGKIVWQAANANGATNVGSFVVGSGHEIVEPEHVAESVEIAALPVTVSGRIAKITETDAYRFRCVEAGLIVCKLDDRLGQPFHGMLAAYDAQGKRIADAADTAGRGLTLVFRAEANQSYTVKVHDLEYGGDRGYVYRLSLAREPHVVGTLPLVVKPGYSGPVEIIGWGVATGKCALESVTQNVNVPADPSGEQYAFTFDSPTGKGTVELALGAATDAKVSDKQELAVPTSLAATIGGDGTARYSWMATKGTSLRIAVEAERFGSQVDPLLVIHDATGKEVARLDDHGNSCDVETTFKAPEDGRYELLITDSSGVIPTRASLYRLTIEPETPPHEFRLQLPEKLDLPLGGKGELEIKVPGREWKSPIALRLEGLPEGVTTSGDLSLPVGKRDMKLALTCAADAPTSATLATLVATSTLDNKPVEQRAKVLVATTMKTRCQVQSAVQDGGRIVHRGTTYPAEVIVQRLDGFTGPVTLMMASSQQRQRRGMFSPSLVVPAEATTAQYPVFMPEWLETSLTCRMNVMCVTAVPDPKGKVRQITGNMDGLIVMSIEGALLHLSHVPVEETLTPGAEVSIPIRVARSAKLAEKARVEVVVGDELGKLITSEPLELAATETSGVVKLKLANDALLIGKREIKLRATAMEQGRWPAVSETMVPLVIEAPRK